MDELVTFGRKVIYSDADSITRDNVLAVLNRALVTHWSNRGEISYLYQYKNGRQPILGRTKTVRPEINNKIVENRADEIVSFKTGYLLGDPIQYISRNGDSNNAKLTALNDYMFAEGKAEKDKELADWFHTCGTAYRMILPTPVTIDDDCPFQLYILNPLNTFVVYQNDLGIPPLMGVYYVVKDNGDVVYNCYTRDTYFRVSGGSVVSEEPHLLGDVPIVEYPLNQARIGSFELVISMLDAINRIDSNRVDGVEQFVQALMKFHNMDIDSKDFETLREQGAIKYNDIDPQLPADVSYISNELKQAETQVLVDYMYQTVLNICGMPNRNGGSSTSDTGSAVIMRDGWSSAEARAKDTEAVFNRSEKRFLKIALRICETLNGMKLNLTDIKIQFTRRNYENIQEKAQVLTTMLGNSKIHPRLAFVHCGLFTDPEQAYSESAKYAEEQEKKALAQAQQISNKQEGGNDPKTQPGDGSPDRKDSQTGQRGGSQD